MHMCDIEMFKPRQLNGSCVILSKLKFGWTNCVKSHWFATHIWPRMKRMVFVWNCITNKTMNYGWSRNSMPCLYCSCFCVEFIDKKCLPWILCYLKLNSLNAYLNCIFVAFLRNFKQKLNEMDSEAETQLRCISQMILFAY